MAKPRKAYEMNRDYRVCDSSSIEWTQSSLSKGAEVVKACRLRAIMTAISETTPIFVINMTAVRCAEFTLRQSGFVGSSLGSDGWQSAMHDLLVHHQKTILDMSISAYPLDQNSDLPLFAHVGIMG